MNSMLFILGTEKQRNSTCLDKTKSENIVWQQHNKVPCGTDDKRWPNLKYTKHLQKFWP